MAIFYTSSVDNFININILRKIRLTTEIIDNQIEKRYVMLNGTELKINKEIELTIEYKGKRISSRFKVVEKRYDGVIVGRDIREKFYSEVKKIQIKCAFKTKEDKVISWTRPIRNRQDQEDFIKFVDELEAREIIETSTSEWISPLVLQRKKNGNLRFCVDFRRLNDLVELDVYAIPNIQEILPIIRGHRWFAVIDLKDRLFQVDIKEEDKEKTPFFTGQ